MSSQIPPNPNVPVFNNDYWINDPNTLTEAEADLLYLKFPVSQPQEETISGNIVVQGLATFNDVATFNNDATITGTLTADGLSNFNNDATFANNVIIGDATANNITTDGVNITQFNANNPLNISSNYGIQIDTTGEILIGDATGGGNGTNITLDDSSSLININNFGITKIGDVFGGANGTLLSVDENNGIINLESPAGSVNIVSPSVINLSADTGGNINIYTTTGAVKIGNITGSGNLLTINATKATLKTTNGFQLLDSSIQYPSAFFNSNQTLSATSSYANSFNGTTLTATLPVVSSTNVGTQFLITNTNAGSMTVNSSSSQSIYSTGTATATSRTLTTGNSQIFTAIRTTNSSTFGWSMV
jgi:hypothetical protein